MKVDVYDTYATGSDGAIVHFDVLVPAGTNAATAYHYACTWLAAVGLNHAELKQSRCNYCHTENASNDVVSDIEADGYHIIRMDG